jgi:hypothetical protein
MRLERVLNALANKENMTALIGDPLKYDIEVYELTN